MKSKNGQKKRGIFDYLLLFIIVCIAATFILSSYVLAKYTTGTSGTGTVKIDSYSVSTTLAESGGGSEIQLFDFSVDSTTSKTCELTIKNDGSISVNYTVTLTNETKNLPLKLTLDSTTDDATNNYVEISSDTPLASMQGSNTATVNIIITMTDSTYNYSSLYREVDRVSVKVVFTQAETTS